MNTFMTFLSASFAALAVVAFKMGEVPGTSVNEQTFFTLTCVALVFSAVFTGITTIINGRYESDDEDMEEFTD